MSGDQALALAGLLVLVIGLLATFSRKLEEWGARFVEWRESRQTVKHTVRSRPLVMSYEGHRRTPEKPVAPPVAQAVQQPRQLIATTDNECNSVEERDCELHNEARDIIRFQTKVEDVVNLYKSGQVTNLAKAIETTFGCSRTSKEDSTYQRAKRAIDPLIAKPSAPTPIAGRETNAVFQSDMEGVV